MALGGTVSDFFAIETVAPWMFQSPRAGVRIGNVGFTGYPASAITPEAVAASLAQHGYNQIQEGEQVGYVDFDVPLGQPNPDYVTGGVLGSVIASVAGTYLPTNGDGSVGDGDGPFPGAPVSDRPAFPEGSIYGPEGTWGQNPLPPGVYDIPMPDTGPDELPPPPIPEEGGSVSRDTEGDPQVAIDWGDVFGGVLSDIGQGLAGPSVPIMPAQYTGPTPGPSTVTVDTRTGKVTPCRRRRRRRLLTSSDLNDLAALKTIVGGGQALNGAVIKAVRR